MSAARDHQGHWLNNDVLNRTANVRRDFDRNRDPMIARQLADMDKTEAERREGSASDGYRIDRAPDPPPEPELKPSPEFRGAADRDGWLEAQRDAAFAQSVQREPASEQTLQPAQAHPGPSL